MPVNASSEEKTIRTRYVIYRIPLFSKLVVVETFPISHGILSGSFVTYYEVCDGVK